MGNKIGGHFMLEDGPVTFGTSVGAELAAGENASLLQQMKALTRSVNDSNAELKGMVHGVSTEMETLGDAVDSLKRRVNSLEEKPEKSIGGTFWKLEFDKFVGCACEGVRREEPRGAKRSVPRRDEERVEADLDDEDEAPHSMAEYNAEILAGDFTNTLRQSLQCDVDSCGSIGWGNKPWLKEPVKALGLKSVGLAGNISASRKATSVRRFAEGMHADKLHIGKYSWSHMELLYRLQIAVRSDLLVSTRAVQ